MITGRGPGAPSVTPDMVCTLSRADRSQAVDLSAIRRTDALIDLLASRRLRRPRALGDPVITLLSSLSADVDGPPGATVREPGVREPEGRGPSVPAGPREAVAGALGGRYYGAHRRSAAPWVRAVSAAMVFLAVAVTTAGLMAVSVLARLAAITARGRTGP